MESLPADAVMVLDEGPEEGPEEGCEEGLDAESVLPERGTDSKALRRAACLMLSCSADAFAV